MRGKISNSKLNVLLSNPIRWGAIALLATCLLAAAGHRVLVATPEHPFDQVHVGDTYVVPLFDGQVADVVAPAKTLASLRSRTTRLR